MLSDKNTAQTSGMGKMSNIKTTYETHCRTQATLNTSDTLVPPRFDEDIKYVVIHPDTTVLHELSLELHSGLRDLSSNAHNAIGDRRARRVITAYGFEKVTCFCIQ